MRQLVSLRVGRQLFGIEILLVREIDTCLDCTPVQLAPSYIVGLANLRGQIVTLFDLGERLGVPNRSIDGATHDIMLRSTTELTLVRSRVHRDDLFTCQDPVGLRVDGIGDIVEVDEDTIDPIPANVRGIERRFLSGVCLLEEELLLVLDLKQLLDAR
jgi:purine-binding chemotaxis protein CheW